MSRPSAAALAVTATAAALLTVAYLIGFLADLPFLARTIERPLGGGANIAVVADLALVAMFGLQHSLMARSGFKRVVSPDLRRSLYLLGSCAALIVLMLAWQPIAAPVWDVQSPTAAGLLWVLFGFGWLLGGLCLLLMNTAELFGFAQLVRPDRPVPSRMSTPFYYRRIRHPLYLGFLFTFWATPHMSVGHALFAAGLTAYILIGIRYEERDLVRRFGNAYLDYRRRAGMLLPRLGRRR